MSDPAQRLTDRLLLRRVTLADLPAILRIHLDPLTNQHRPGGAPSQLEAERDIEGFIGTWQEYGVGYWVAELEGEVVGVAGIRPFLFCGRDSWNLYYRFAPSAWGKGLATEAACEAVTVARELLPARPVVARTRPKNLSAARVAESAGLQRRAELDADEFIIYACGW